jgi:uncharacterized PurR-regulated membrane protein YhhQ (DUF165 family)
MKSKKDDLYFYLLSIFHVASMLTAMTMTSRIISLNSIGYMMDLKITGGVFLIPVVFFIQDIVTEVYGYSNAKKCCMSPCLYSWCMFFVYIY